MSTSLTNPFSVKTPETMTAQEVVDLFVPISEYFDIEDPGHVFVHGHRGCGKSMMFRLMSPDCQALRSQTNLQSLPFYGVYLSIKATDLNIPEFHRLDNQLAGYILGEHTLVGYLVVKTLQSICDNLADHIDQAEKIEELRTFCVRNIIERLEFVGWNGDKSGIRGAASAKEMLTQAIKIFDSIHVEAVQYLKRIGFIQEIIPYSGPLLGFQDFLFPLLKNLRTLSFMPRGSIYLLIDDADNLNDQQTQVLNTWVSYRTTADLSLKISTQLNYKTYLTTSGQRIESPHDYSEVFVSGIYTGPAKEKYPKWVEEIVSRRLHLSGITTNPREFFPPDEKQEEEIAQIAEEYKTKWTPDGPGGYRPRDDAYRYARPEYIKRLLGPSKQGATYKYAGFDQLVHISSGIIRFFLDPAHKMFSEEQRNADGGKIESISSTIQDKVIREISDEILLNDFDKLIADIDRTFKDNPERVQKMKKLRNLIFTIGALFQQILLSERSERRVFSFAISDEPDPEVKEVLDLGIQYGYFYVSSIGTKEGMGRTRLYVLTRRLAPFFKLDPTGFSGYKFVTNSFLRSALERPKTMQNRIKEFGVEAVLSSDQQSFDFNGAADED